MSFINLRILYDPADLKQIGIMVIGIDEANLSGIYSDFSQEAYIINKNGILVSHYDKSLIGAAMADDSLYIKISESGKPMDTISITSNNITELLTFKKIATNNAYFVFPFNYYRGTEVIGSESFKFILGIIVLIAIAMSIVFAFIFSKVLSKSILSLKKTVQAVYEGNLNARYKSEDHDEISYLGHKFNEMLVEINNLFTKQKDQENMNKILEIKLLQSQINPHLLYNTLDSTLGSLEDRNIPQAKELILSLSSFFKITLSGGKDLIPVQKEFELVRNYIGIQNSARGKNIGLCVQMTPPLCNFKIIKLTIQPIVENSILHGFSGFRDDGVITIRVRMEDRVPEVANSKNIRIIIEDNGIGILQEDLAAINAALDVYPPETELTHFGLYNVQRRIKNLFGNEYGIRLESEVGNYSRVVMVIPLIQFDEEEGTKDG